VDIGNALSREQWTVRLNKEWSKLRDTAVEGFFQLGRSLVEARAQLERGEWIRMVEGDLEFNQRVAQRLMRIATWSEEKRINDTFKPISGLLPPDYNTIDMLARLDKIAPDIFEQLIDDGTLCPSLQRNEVSKILRQQKVAADEQRVLKLEPTIGKFRTLVFDPAWEYEVLSLAGRAKPDYAMQTLDQLRALDILRWAEPDCHLYVWTTNNFMYEANKLVDQWGFQHRTLITWVKPPPFGLGSYFRNSTEHVLFATRGETTTRPAAASIPTHFEAPRGGPSEKPEKFYEIVRAASYPPYGEGNQREPRPDFVNLFEVRDGLDRTELEIAAE
jgi:N6-adenosine-specific RNA methylase IME4